MSHSTPSDTAAPEMILIVESSRGIQAELKGTVESSFDKKVELASSYQDAREILDRSAPEIFLAIVSLNLADAQNGEIVDLVSSMAVPCLVYTSLLDADTRARMLSRNIIDYVVKDSHTIDNLLAYIHRLERNCALRVLVVEDSESFRFAISSLLHRQMFQVIDVPDAESALSILAEESIDLVITDYVLPGMNGVDLTRLIRADHSKDSIPIIGISATSEAMITATFLKSGANDFIAKPFEAEEFYCRVDHNIETREQIHALRLANDVKNQFIGTTVHDLRNPINGINGLTRLLLDAMSGELNSEQRELIEYINDASQHMNSMVNDLLDISQIEAGKLLLVKTDADLVGLVEKSVRVHGITAKHKSITLHSLCDKIDSFSFDSRRILQVLDNLLTNAIKFSPAGKSIEVTLKMDGDFVVVGVHDHGPGVSPDEEALLFETYARTSAQPTGGESSVGLGLPIVKRIVETHQGQVWVESDPGHGASFYFSLPIDGAEV